MLNKIVYYLDEVKILTYVFSFTLKFEISHMDWKNKFDFMI